MHRTRTSGRIASVDGGMVIGEIVGLDPDGAPRVGFRGQSARGRTVTPVRAEDVGRPAVLLFENGDPRRPVVMGVLQEPLARPGAQPVRVRVDGEEVVLAADRELTLRCGKATITLTRAGKILLRGAYVLSRSTGVNRIKGGSVQIN